MSRGRARRPWPSVASKLSLLPIQSKPWPPHVMAVLFDGRSASKKPTTQFLPGLTVKSHYRDLTPGLVPESGFRTYFVSRLRIGPDASIPSFIACPISYDPIMNYLRRILPTGAFPFRQLYTAKRRSPRVVSFIKKTRVWLWSPISHGFSKRFTWTFCRSRRRSQHCESRVANANSRFFGYS